MPRLAALGRALRWAAKSRRAHVAGASMLPALLPGEVVLAVPEHPTRAIVGAVVLARDPATGRLDVKRVVAGPGDHVVGDQYGCWVNGMWWGLGLGGAAPGAGSQRCCGPEEYFLLGDNPPRSTDSRATGPVVAAAIEAVVWLVVWPPHRARRVSRRPPAVAG